MGIERDKAKQGTVIRVNMDARVKSGTGGPNGTTPVEDTLRQNNHFVFLQSEYVTGDKTVGGMVHIEFEANIDGDYEGERLITTRVRETGGDRYVHYLYLNNPTITLADNEPAKTEDKPAATPVKPKRVKGELTVTISSYDDIINSDDVRTAIRELTEDAVKFAVIRNRNDEELGLFDDRTEALDYIDEEDLNPERVRVDETVDPDIAEELATLKELDSDGDSNISDWSYNVTLYRESYIDRDFARDRFEEIAPRDVDLDAPPFVYIEWDRYAVDLKEGAETVEFDGVTYYAL